MRNVSNTSILSIDLNCATLNVVPSDDDDDVIDPTQPSPNRRKRFTRSKWSDLEKENDHSKTKASPKPNNIQSEDETPEKIFSQKKIAPSIDSTLSPIDVHGTSTPTKKIRGKQLFSAEKKKTVQKSPLIPLRRHSKLTLTRRSSQKEPKMVQSTINFKARV